MDKENISQQDTPGQDAAIPLLPKNISALEEEDFYLRQTFYYKNLAID
jgi:hypothetical protein